MRLIRKKFLASLLVVLLALLVLPPLPLSAASSRYQETEVSITYSGTWGTYSNPAASGGSQKYSKATGSAATFTFVGTSVSWIISKNSNYGIAKVYIDGALDSSVDLYNPTLVWQQVVYSKGGLASGTHTIKVETSGTKNSLSTDYYIGVDAFETDGSAVPPGKPTSVSLAAPSDGGRLTIKWDIPNSTNFSHVEIERTDSRYGDSRILPDKFTSSPSQDRNLAGGIAYSYKLRAVDTGGNASPWTDPVSATPYSMAPSNVLVENEGSGGKMVISWTNPAAGTYDSIRVYRSSVEGSLGVPVTLDRIEGTSIVDIGLTNGATYYYTVRSVDFAARESLNSDQHPGTPSVSQTRYEETSAQVVFSGVWSDMSGSNYSAGGSKVSNEARAAAEFTFTSTSVAWIGAKSTNAGIARVLIDGVQQSSVDLYSPSKIYQQKVYIKTGLTNTTHILRVEVTGTKNSASSGTYVDVDAFDFDATPSAGISPPTPSATAVAGATAGNGEIVGRVVNRAGQTIPGTAIRVNATVVPTNPGGEFRFTLVGAGVYTVYYDAPGYRGQTQVIEVKSGQATRCPTVIMDPGITPSTQGEIYGRVVNPVHQPIAGAAVRINNAVMPTNAAGEFRFQLVNPGVYTVYYDATGYAGQSQLLEVKAGMVTYPPMVILSGTLGEIYGRALDMATRRAIPGTAVRVNGSVMPTNPGGEFRFTLVHPGIYKVYYDAPGYKSQVQEVVAVFAGTTTICPTALMSR